MLFRSFEITYKHASARYQILIENPNRVSCGVAQVEVDGQLLEAGETDVVLLDDARTHTVRVILGQPRTIGTAGA